MSTTSHAPMRLITPEILTADRAAAFTDLPPWATGGTLLDPGLSLDQDAFVVPVGETKPMVLILNVVSAAILCELTRYGNSIATNRNTSARSAITKVYAKITFAGAPEDTMPASRIVMAAGPRQAVVSGDDRGDLRPELLAMRGGGKPTKDAREVAIRHASDLASAAGVNVDAYVANLRALFDLHDTLHLGTLDY